MSRNKGYTLVELMVAVAVLLLVMAEVGALMVNSQSLYKNGYYEVNLQENSQQVVQTVQDLLMNANVPYSLTVTTGTSLGIDSDIVSFKTKERQKSGDVYLDAWDDVTYKIGRRTDLDASAVPKSGKVGLYTDLVLVRDVGGTSTTSLIAEGVQSIYITKNKDIESTAGGDMFNVSTADVVSISMNMVNESYRYSSAGEVYLRNKIGTGGDPMPDGGSGSAADVDLTILRIHTYDLKKFVPAEYHASFAFIDGAAGSYYDLNTSTGEFKCKSDLNTNWEWEKECDLVANSSSGGTYKIHVSTPKVNDGNRMPIYTWSNTTSGMINAIPVNGICTCSDCAQGYAYMDGQITIGIGNGSNSIIQSGGSGKTVDLAVLADNGLNSANCKGFLFKRHKDEGAGEEMGTPVPAWNCPATFSNEIFNRVKEGDTIPLQRAYLSICPMEEDETVTQTHDKWEYVDESTKDHQYRNLYYKYLLSGAGNPGDPYAYSGQGNQRCMYLPDPGTTGGASFADFTLGRIHVDNKANGFSVNTTNHADNSSAYWNYMVDNGCYIRMHIWCKFKGLPDSADYKYIYDCYGYYFPQTHGTDAQHETLMNMIKEAPPASDIQPVATSGDPKPYEYYGF